MSYGSPNRERSRYVSNPHPLGEISRGELHTDSSQTETKCNGSVLNTERLDWTTTHGEHFVVEEIYSIGDSDNNQHVSEDIDIPLLPERINLDDHCTSELQVELLDNERDQQGPPVSITPSELVITEQIEESLSVPEYPVTVVVPPVTPQTVVQLPEGDNNHNTKQEAPVSIAESSSEPTVELPGEKEPSSHTNQLSGVSLTESCQHETETMEECLPMPSESNAVSCRPQTEEAIAVDEQNRYTSSHSVPHHSLTVSLSDAESPPSHQVGVQSRSVFYTC